MSDFDDPTIPAPPRSLLHDGLLLLAALIVLAAQFLTDRPLAFVNRPTVDDVAPLPAKADKDRYEIYIADNRYMIPIMRRPDAINFTRWMITHGDKWATPDRQVRVGWSLREVDALGMPFFAYKEIGYVLYLDDQDFNAQWVSAAPMGDEGLDLLRRETGDATIAKGWFFPFWAHMWGWVPLLLAATWGWLQWRRMVRRREQLGII